MSNSPTQKLKMSHVLHVFQLYTQIAFGLKWNEDRQFGDFSIPLAQTSAAHVFRFYPILTIESQYGPWPAHICTPVT